MIFRIMFLFAFAALSASLTGCAGNPVNAVPVKNFDADRYLGTWYEIARMDHSFERGMTDVTANYTKRDKGGIVVKNRGYKVKKGKFSDAVGKAKFKGDEDTGHLKVSFFGPFYGDYIVFDMDQENYSYAYISGGKDNYLWLLARTPEVSESVKQDFISKSEDLGYNTDELIWVDQSRAE